MCIIAEIPWIIEEMCPEFVCKDQLFPELGVERGKWWSPGAFHHLLCRTWVVPHKASWVYSIQTGYTINHSNLHLNISASSQFPHG